MKTSLFVTSLLFTFGLNLPAQATVPDGHVMPTLIKLCQSTADDNKRLLLTTMKNHRVSQRDLINKMVCNGQPLMEFARNQQAYKVVKMLEPTERRLRGAVSIRDIAPTP